MLLDVKGVKHRSKVALYRIVGLLGTDNHNLLMSYSRHAFTIYYIFLLLFVKSYSLMSTHIIHTHFIHRHIMHTQT